MFKGTIIWLRTFHLLSKEWVSTIHLCFVPKKVHFCSKRSPDGNVEPWPREEAHITKGLIKVSMKLYWTECSRFVWFFPPDLLPVLRKLFNSLPQWQDFRNRCCLQERKRGVVTRWPTAHKSPLTDGKEERKAPRGLNTEGFYKQ